MTATMIQGLREFQEALPVEERDRASGIATGIATNLGRSIDGLDEVAILKVAGLALATLYTNWLHLSACERCRAELSQDGRPPTLDDLIQLGAQGLIGLHVDVLFERLMQSDDEPPTTRP